jgi:hypothetical protein
MPFLAMKYFLPHTAQKLRFRVVRHLFAVCVCSCFFASCSSTPPITSPEQVVFPASNVSFSRHVQPFFAVTCNFAGCHNSRSQAGRVVLESYFDVVFTTPGLVIANNPEQSRLVQVIDLNGRIRAAHPLSFQPLINQNHIDGIKTWIREGAQ